MSVDPLAVSAVALVAPYLADLAKGAAEAVGGDAAKAVLAWMRAKLGGTAKEALEDLEQDPGLEENLADLRKRLRKALEAEPALADELRALLPSGVAAQPVQVIQGDIGAGAAVVQSVGSGNTIGIRTGRD